MTIKIKNFVRYNKICKKMISKFKDIKLIKKENRVKEQSTQRQRKRNE